MEQRKTIPLSDIELQINQLISNTMMDVAKVEDDIKKLPARGVLQLDYKPRNDVPNWQQKEILRDVQKLKGVVENLKANALVKTDEITAHLSLEHQKTLRGMAEEKLFPDKSKPDKTLSSKEKNSLDDKDI